MIPIRARRRDLGPPTFGTPVRALLLVACVLALWGLWGMACTAN